MNLELISEYIKKYNTPNKIKNKNFSFRESYGDDYEKLSNEILSFGGYENLIGEYSIRVAYSATELIYKFFEKYVGKNTLIITTENEHQNVNILVGQFGCDRIAVKVDEIENKLDVILNASLNYDNVVIYFIGTEYSTGIINEDSSFVKLKNILEVNDIPAVLCIDSCQEFFVYKDRDYRNFDYIIYTGHSIVPDYDLGFIIGRKDILDFGYCFIDRLSEYFSLLKNSLKNEGFCKFNSLMRRVFEYEIEKGVIETFDNSISHLFCFKIPFLKSNCRSIIDEFKTNGFFSIQKDIRSDKEEVIMRTRSFDIIQGKDCEKSMNVFRFLKEFIEKNAK